MVIEEYFLFDASDAKLIDIRMQSFTLSQSLWRGLVSGSQIAAFNA